MSDIITGKYRGYCLGMKIIADISPETFERLQKLVREGRYATVAQAVAVALENQLLLEESQEPVPGAATAASVPARGDALPPAATPAASRPWQAGLRSPIGEIATTPVSPSASAFSPYWLWGVNRIAPIKFGVRVLAKALERGRPVSLKSYIEEAGQLASEFGRWLAGIDDAAGHRRGERLSAGFPLGKLGSEEGSRGRYADLFLACVRKRDGRVDGALPALQLITLTDGEGGPAIGITEAGLRFARLESPLTDTDAPDKALSDGERGFYLSHVRASVPQEMSALSEVIGAVARGAGTVEAVDRCLKQRHSDWTDKAVSSVRVTIIGRLLELQLLTRKREGLTAAYSVTPEGERFLPELEQGAN